MKLAILHYHLNRGGVTRVIENHLRSLNLAASSGDSLDVLVLHGGRLEGWPGEIEQELARLNLRVLPIAGLDYDELSASHQPNLTENLRTCLNEHGFSPDESLLHVHNHNLGKNAAFPRAFGDLAEAGYRLLLQIHDFAEDFRPVNYQALTEAFSASERAQLLYPQAGHIHYAVLNNRDDGILEDAGVPKPRRHFLPNPVPELGTLPDQQLTRDQLASKWNLPRHLPLFLYPVRGIRRKNVGEMLLWSAVHQGKASFAITLAPLNPRELVWYEGWRTFAEEHSLPCWWKLGGEGGLGFLENLAAADRVLTTSVAEGFGMVFLEAWLADRPLYGRNLPAISADFVNEGLQLPTLYDALRVPSEWINEQEYTQAIQEALTPLLTAFGRPAPSSDEIRELVENRLRSGACDFGELDENLQKKVILRVLQSQEAREELLQRNPQLELFEADQSELIAANQAVIREKYSLEGSGRRLVSIYESLLESQVSDIQPIRDSEKILEAFLSLPAFKLIRS